MLDTEYKRLIQSAKDRALFGFLALVQRAIQDADNKIAEMLAQAKLNLDRQLLVSVQHFLRQDGNVFLRSIDALFRANLDRAMQTMFVDLRHELQKVSLSELALVDDEVMNHQIEVGRLAQRMREANEEGIGRLNVIIAQLHGQREAKERENPFRPYLLARTLYDAIRETVGNEPKAKPLFEYLADAFIRHLPAYYDAIQQAFQSSGVQGKFIAQRSRAVAFQRYFGAPRSDGADVSGHYAARIMPGLQRMLEALPPAQDSGKPATVQDFIRAMLAPSHSSTQPSDNGIKDILAARRLKANAATPLAAQLAEYQKKVAQGEPISVQEPQEQNQLFALRESIKLEGVSPMEKMTFDVVGMLFEFILEDEQIPAELRQRIGRLQIPVLKAAVLDPDLMQDENHPARQLLNRLSSAAIGSDPDSPAGQKLSSEIDRIVCRVLDEFDTGVAIFSRSLTEFSQFLSNTLREDDAHITKAIEAVEIAERISVLLTNTTNLLCEVLMPLNVDKGISDFIIRIWPHVLVRAAWDDADKKNSSEPAASSALQSARMVLPELLWSIQEKQDSAERAALIRLLPELVKRLTRSLQLIQLPEEERQQILDQLVRMHTAVLRASPNKDKQSLPTLEELQRNFARVTINWDRVSWELSDPPQPRDDVLEEVLAKYGVPARLDFGINTIATTPADREFLTQTYLLGTRVEICAAEGAAQQAQLAWVSAHRSLYLFRQDKDSALVIYTFSALLEALREGMVIPLEYAPVFERAVESLLFSAEKIQAA